MGSRSNAVQKRVSINLPDCITLELLIQDRQARAPQARFHRWWSRRIDQERRMARRLRDDTLEIAALRYHCGA